ncbi:MAG: hypothetical protein LAO07_11415 [Acidobacteriia bacterium]|nr:hypothetical protein [Terriglobia bacterium]
MRKKSIAHLAVGAGIFLSLLAVTPSRQRERTERSFRPNVPKTWDDAALADWATPVAGLNVRPTHMSEKEYYSMAVENLRTYPVYYPGRESRGYWEMLQHVGPKPLIEPEKLKSEADWIEAGRRVFDEVDDLHLRTFDPKLIAAARSRETFEAIGTQPYPDGTVDGVRWAPTKQGVALSIAGCKNCHLLTLPDGTRVPGAPTFAQVSRTHRFKYISPFIFPIHSANRVIPTATPFFMGSEPYGMWLYQAFGVPWEKDDIHERLKTATTDQGPAINRSALIGGGLPRWNGSPFYPTKVPDLIGIRDRKYIDHTATHLHRDIGDLMRYAALVSFAEPTDFGPYHVTSPDTKRVRARLSDEALYALALYIYSLQPPHNPNPFDRQAKLGQKIFEREGCVMCHTPPLYTSNKLTLAEGFTPPEDAPKTLDILPISVGTDPGLALKTRKGTGYYKVPSLKGVWYRGHYLHDGSAASLEEMFDPGRVKETHVPGGWSPPGTKTWAIKGHPFGLDLSAEDRKALIAFLKTL